MRDRAAPDRARPAVRGGAADRPRRGPDRPGQPAARADRVVTIVRPPMTQPGEVRIRRALLSVSDKTGIVEFAKGLAALDIELVSTGGTAQALEAAGLTVRAIEDFTGFPEIMGGRVKTLHPKLYAGLLARRDDPAHMVAAEEHAIEFVDLVCVNLYPFEETAARRGATDERGDREHRHRRPDDDPGRGEELRVLRRRGRARELRRDPAGARRPRGPPLARARARASPPRRSPARRATTRRSRAGSPRSSTTSRP